MTPHQGNTLLLRSSQQLPRLLKRLFELTRRHRLRANDLPRALLLELQRNKDTVRHVGSRKQSKTVVAHLD